MLKIKKVKTIVKPPILTIGVLWIFLGSGKSKILNLYPKLLTSGPIKKPNAEQANIFKNMNRIPSCIFTESLCRVFINPC